MVELSAGHPLYLGVLIDMYVNAKQQGSELKAEHLGFAKKDVLARFVDHIDQRIALCLKILSIPDVIDQDIFDYLSDIFPSAFLGTSYAGVTGYSFFQTQQKAETTMHAVMRESLSGMLDSRLRERVNKAMFEWFQRRTEELKDQAFASATECFFKSIEHRSHYDQPGYIQWVLEQDNLFDHGRFDEVLKSVQEIAKTDESYSQLCKCLNLRSTIVDSKSLRLNLLREELAIHLQHKVLAHEEEACVRCSIICLNQRIGNERTAEETLQSAEEFLSRHDLYEGLPARHKGWLAFYCSAAYFYKGEFSLTTSKMQEAFNYFQSESDIDSIGHELTTTRLLNIYKFDGKPEKIREIASLALEKHKLSGNERFLESLSHILTMTDKQLGKTIIPPRSEDTTRNIIVSERTRFLTAMNNIQNIGLVVNARGKLCLVYDRVFPVFLDKHLHVRYCVTSKKIYLCLNKHFVYQIEWETTDEMHSYFMRINSILFILIENKRPVEGFDVQFVKCEFPAEVL